VEILSNLNVNPLLHERKAAPHKRKVLLLTTFWQRFWILQHAYFKTELAEV